MTGMAAAQARLALGRELAAARRAAGYTQATFAPLVGYSRSTVGNVETGRQHVPRTFWGRCDQVLGTQLTQRFDHLVGMTDAAADSRVVGSFVRRITAGQVGAEVLAQIAADVQRLAARRCAGDPIAACRDIRVLRDRVFRLLGRTRQPAELCRLYLAVVRLCGLQAQVCVSLGLYPEAETYARAALRIAGAAALHTWNREPLGRRAG
jgi:hypothetical protein